MSLLLLFQGDAAPAPAVGSGLLLAGWRNRLVMIVVVVLIAVGAIT